MAHDDWCTSLRRILSQYSGAYREFNLCPASTVLNAFKKKTKNSETSNKALKAVNDTNLVPFLVSFLQAYDRLPLSTVNAAGDILPDWTVEVPDLLPAQCLYVLTEENDSAIEIFRNESSYVSSLFDIAQKEAPGIHVSEEGNKGTPWITLRVLVSGDACFASKSPLHMSSLEQTLSPFITRYPAEHHTVTCSYACIGRRP